MDRGFPRSYTSCGDLTPLQSLRRYVTPRRLTEFNPCHMPAGDSDGGRFAPKGEGNCAVPLMDSAWKTVRERMEAKWKTAGEEFAAAPPAAK